MDKQPEFPIQKFQFNSNSIFEGLPVEDFKAIESKMLIQKYKKGQSIFVEGTYPSGIYYVKQGRVKKYKSDREGREHIIYICNKGELLGYSALLSEEAYPDSSAAIENSVIGFIPRDIFLKILHHSPALSVRLLKNLSHEFGVLVNSVAAFAHKSVRERLALSLLIVKERFREADQPANQIQINLSREDLSNIVGTAVETLVRLLHSFKDEGLIESHGRKIKILNETELIRIANLH